MGSHLDDILVQMGRKEEGRHVNALCCSSQEKGFDFDRNQNANVMEIRLTDGGKLAT